MLYVLPWLALCAYVCWELWRLGQPHPRPRRRWVAALRRHPRP
jgi:hypothetical protein